MTTAGTEITSRDFYYEGNLSVERKSSWASIVWEGYGGGGCRIDLGGTKEMRELAEVLIGTADAIYNARHAQ